MFDKEAIEDIQLAHAVEAADASLSGALGDGTGNQRQDAIALPDNFKLHDIEHLKPTRRRARGLMRTRLLAPFAAYVKANAELGASVFLDPVQMKASAVLNLGTPAAPGHADNQALFEPSQTAPYLALLTIAELARNQRAVAEFIEDWAPQIQCFADAEEIKPPAAVAAVRKLTIESARKSESTVEPLSASRSSFESIQASSKSTLPTWVYFTCKPYADLSERLFVLRLGVTTGDAAPMLTLRIQRPEEHVEQMADECAVKLRDAFGEGAPPIFVGSYARSN